MSHRANIWHAIRQQPRCFTAPALVAQTRAAPQTVRAYIDALVKAGLVEPAGRDMDNVTCRYSLIRDVGPLAPRVNGDTGALTSTPTARYRLWQAARVMRRYSVADLAATAECGVDSARQFAHDLVRARYARITQPANRKRAQSARHQLVRDTGPLPLVRSRARNTITDPNTNEVFEL